MNARMAILRLLGEGVAEKRTKGGVDRGEVRFRRQVLHEDLGHAVAVKGDLSRQELVVDDSEGVNIDPRAIVPRADLGGHVVNGADADRLPALPRHADELREAVIADLGVAVLVEDVFGFEVAVNDAVVVEVAQALGDPLDEVGRAVHAQSVGMPGENLPQRRPAHVLHDDDGPAVGSRLHVEDTDEVGALEVHAVANAPQLDIVIVLDHLQRDLATPVADRVVHLAEASATQAAEYRVAVQRSIAVAKTVGHARLPRVKLSP